MVEKIRNRLADSHRRGAQAAAAKHRTHHIPEGRKQVFQEVPRRPEQHQVGRAFDARQLFLEVAQLLPVEERRITVNVEIEHVPLGLATQYERGLAGAVHFIPLVLHGAVTPGDEGRR